MMGTLALCPPYDFLRTDLLRAQAQISMRNCDKSTRRAKSYLRRMGRAKRNPSPSAPALMGIASLHPSYGGCGERSPCPLIQNPPVIRAVQRECRHVDLEPLAAFADHLVAPGHEARRGRQWHAAGVFEALARREHGLLADHAFAADFLLASGGAGDDPVPGAELYGLGAGIGDDDGVGPEILALVDRRALGEEVRFDRNFDLAGDGAVHAGKLSEILFRIIAKNAGGTISGPPGLPVV